MLKVKPNCECCNCHLPADSVVAMICSYECTFCQPCVDETLANVCPNCGGGFQPRPIRPTVARRAGISLAHQPASSEPVHMRYSVEELRIFAAPIKDIPPQDR